MKILYLTPSFQHPKVRGSIRHYYFLRELAQRHSLTLLTVARSPIPPEAMAELRSYTDRLLLFDAGDAAASPLGKAISQIPRVGSRGQQFLKLQAAVGQMKAAFTQLVAQEPFDLVLFHGKPCYRVIDGWQGLPLVIDVCDATSLRLRTRMARVDPAYGLLLRLRYWQIRRIEQKMVQQTPYLAFISERDRAAVPGVPPQARVIPSGIDLAYWTRRSHDPEPNCLIFTGVMDYAPNNDAALYLIDQILPLVRPHVPNLKLIIAGRNPTPELRQRAQGQPDVVVTGFVEDMRNSLEKATLFVSPLRFGAGLQHKIQEALAMEVPVVTTPLVAEGLQIGKEQPPLCVAESAPAFAESILRLLGQPAERARLAQAGRNYVQRHFVWQQSAARLEELCVEACMSNRTSLKRGLAQLWLLAVLLSGLLAGTPVLAQTGTPLSGVGYLDFSYNPTNDPAIANSPTGEKPESKLWWNDGFWWGSLYNPTAGEYRIYRLNWGAQTWEDTGVALDTRDFTKADVLWDAANNKLYVVSHIYTALGARTTNVNDRGQLLRYTYDPTTQRYALDAGFPVNVNENKTETLVIAQERTNADNLWVTYVSRLPPATDYFVFVNHSTDGGATWGTPFALAFPEATVSEDDIASIIAFEDQGGPKIGVAWGNSLTDELYLATHADGQPADSGWTLETIALEPGPDDHVNLKALHATASGHLFAAIKTSAVVSDTTAPEIGMVVRRPDGVYSFHQYSTRASNDTRPIAMIDEGVVGDASDDQAYLFVTGKPGGSRICYQSLPVSELIGNPTSTFPNPTTDCGTAFLEDLTHTTIDNATSSKHNVNATTGLVVLASDNTAKVYVHNVLGNPPPVVVAAPGRYGVAVGGTDAVQVTFSKPMLAGSFTPATFQVHDGAAPVAGSFTLDPTGRTVTFLPEPPLQLDTVYTVTLTNGIQDASGQVLFQRAAFAGDPTIHDQWAFRAARFVQLSSDSYSVLESAGSATITATLSITASTPVTVAYSTSDGTAIAGEDYTATSGTLTFAPGERSQRFTIPITADAVEESDETVRLTLTAAGNATLGEPATATLTIIDSQGGSGDATLYLPLIRREQ
jgi:glycosyltransferase involved in cell wall biosynthesis